MILRDYIIEKLIEAKISSPRLETDIILKNFAPNYPEINDDEEKKVKDALFRRINHEPLDKIIGEKEFYKFSFKVNSNVLSPRPDTEILVESALSLMDDETKYRIIDFGTGSGCILLSLIKDKQNISGIGIDISSEALEVAKYNALKLDVFDRVDFYNKSWNNLDCNIGQFDFILSNPPYIPYNEFLLLDKEVRDFDPKISLIGEGEDGLNCYKEIAKIAPKFLKNNGYILLEVGYNQAKKVADIFSDNGFQLIDIVKDLADINRCVILKK
ncbi:MAG: peptide chain release factor N(5)-glutamine methyltransferase [Alphaproteobacteria bacterium]|nr:peptide chain release factor N(5)-glutamine methyltransferase [Alphaproteobacteria bacterium]